MSIELVPSTFLQGITSSSSSPLKLNWGSPELLLFWSGEEEEEVISSKIKLLSYTGENTTGYFKGKYTYLGTLMCTLHSILRISGSDLLWELSESGPATLTYSVLYWIDSTPGLKYEFKHVECL